MSGFDQLPLDGVGRALYPKEGGATWVKTRVLVTVKAAPQPSKKYGDTVCVAGIRMRDTGPEWIRLYPLPFRSMDQLEQFQKYELIDVKVKPASDDFRSESYRPDRSSLEHVQVLPPWKARHAYVKPLADQWSMCQINQASKDGKPYPSLAVVRPREVLDLEMSPHPGWTVDQQAKLTNSFQQLDLFDVDDRADRRPLEAPRFIAKFRYACDSSSCGGHLQSLIDWEATELIRRHHRLDPDDVAAEALRQRFLHEMCDPGRGPLFFVGNQLQAPRGFTVLGVYRTIG